MVQAAKTTAIVLNYNGGEKVAHCIESLLGGEYQPKVLLVDNASTDDSLERLKKYFPNLPILRNEQNLGFAAGMNRGIRKALEEGAEFLWLINNDATVLPDTLTKLLEAARKFSGPILFSPAIYKEDRITPWFLKGTISYLRMRATHVLPRQAEPLIQSEYLTGCALFLNRETIERVGYFDERYFLYYEDAAYSIIAKRNGVRSWVVSESRVLHAEQSEGKGEKIYWLVLSGIHFFRSMSPWYWRPWIELYILLRRMKNTLDLLVDPTLVAQHVRRAYTDASYV